MYTDNKNSYKPKRLEVMKTTKFTRDSLGEIRNDLMVAIKSVGDKYGIDLRIGSISFDSCSFKGNLKGSVIDEKGNREVSERIHAMADRRAGTNDIPYHKHVIGSTYVSWSGESYKVIDFAPSRRQYPFELLRLEDNKRSKASTAFLMNCTLVDEDGKLFSLKDFSVWCTVDIESDRVSRSDEKIYDRVNGTLSKMSHEVIVDKFMDEINRLEEEKKLTLHATNIYNMLMEKGMADTVKFLNTIK